MNNTSKKLQKIISDYSILMKDISQKDFVDKSHPNKWSSIEILGHLIDSAQTNIRRFIVAQYEESPYIVYDQDKWVAIADYQHCDARELIELWRLLNNHVCRVLDNTPEEAATRICETNEGTPHTIAWLAEDYIKHLLHHLHQILQLEPVPYR